MLRSSIPPLFLSGKHFIYCRVNYLFWHTQIVHHGYTCRTCSFGPIVPLCKSIRHCGALHCFSFDFLSYMLWLTYAIDFIIILCALTLRFCRVVANSRLSWEDISSISKCVACMYTVILQSYAIPSVNSVMGDVKFTFSTWHHIQTWSVQQLPPMSTAFSYSTIYENLQRLVT